MLGVYSAPPSSGVPHLIDATPYLTACTLTTNVHGFEGLSAAVRRALRSAFQLYDQPGLLYVGLFWNGQIVWEGRLEDPSLAASGGGSGLSLGALGGWRALSDLPYTALLSTTALSGFAPISPGVLGARLSERWTFSTQDAALYIAPNKNENFPAGTIGEITYQTPVGGSRTINGVQFDVDFTAPANWTLRVLTYNRDFSGGVTQYTLTSAGAQLLRSVHLTFTGQDRLSFLFSNATGGNVLKATDTGVDYARITNVRMVSVTTNRVNTTLTANRAAGANVTATVGSTAGMYVGQRLVINSAGNPSESVLVLSIGSSTQFNATFVNNYVIGNAVQGHQVTSEQIVGAIVSTVSALNSAQLSNSAALIQATSLDITDALYEDAAIGDIISDLAALGDSSGALWETGVYEGRMLFFRPKGTVSRAWFVDASDLSVARSLEQLANSIYAVYEDANGFAQRSSATSDATSIARYGVTRRQALQTQTTIAATAQLFVNTALADRKDPQPRAAVRFDGIFDALGSRYPLWLVRTGDTITVRNLPPNLSATVDRIRTFRISHTSYDALTDTLTIEPETPQPTLEVMLARRAEGVTS